MILPPVKFIDSLAKDITHVGDEKGLEIVGSVPVVGKLAYWHMGRGTSKRDDLWDIRLRKEKRRLGEIKQRMDESDSPIDFRREHRQELMRLDMVNALQGQLNQYRKRINILEGRGGADAEVAKLKEKRISLIKKYLKE
jgi:hypothetical protein